MLLLKFHFQVQFRTMEQDWNVPDKAVLNQSQYVYKTGQNSGIINYIP